MCFRENLSAAESRFVYDGREDPGPTLYIKEVKL